MENVNKGEINSKNNDLCETCPICKKELNLFSINFKETMKMCPDKKCSYPFRPSDSLEIFSDKMATTSSDISIPTVANLSNSKCLDEYDFNLDDIILPITEGDEVYNTDLNDILNDLMTSFESKKP